MPNFLENIFSQLKRAEGRVVLREIRGEQFVSSTGGEMLEQVQRVRGYLCRSGLHPGDRCALLAANSVRWAAFDLALMAEGAIVVPLYSRQAPAELVAMMKDCRPRFLFVADTALGEGVAQAWPEAPPGILFEEVLQQPASPQAVPDLPNLRSDSDIVTIIYTSGTSGEPKGVCLTAGNVTHMISCTTERLDQLMGETHEPDRVFHYLPFNFAASWIVLLTYLTRETVLTLSTDLSKLAGKIKERFGAHLRTLICGSAPLSPETQQFFLMLGIPVLQGYGLTETTGICTLDDPRLPVEAGYVGTSISGIEMKIAENEEIVVRGPHIFPGYWNRPEETARVLQDGWFYTGDQGEVNVRGNWRISGRIKNLIILNSGHNIAPEPVEGKIAQLLPAAQQVVVVGNGRGYLCALVTGGVERAAVQAALDTVNPELPHYRQIRNFTVIPEGFTIGNGLLTVNGKLRRSAINARYASEINAMYDAKGVREAASGKLA